MQKALYYLLNEISKHPSYSIQKIADLLRLPVHVVQQAVETLHKMNMVMPSCGGYYTTFLGRIALEEQNMRRAETRLRQECEALQVICEVLSIQPTDIAHFTPLAFGMTNHLFLLEAQDKKYVYRMPGEGSERLVDRYREYNNYLALAGHGWSETVVYHNPESGIKITEYIPNTRQAQPDCPDDVQRCMARLRDLHTARLSVPHCFNFGEAMDYYEHLCREQEITMFDGYHQAREAVLWVRKIYEKLPHETCMCHIDCIPDNFLITESKNAVLIDWEYAGMCDPLADPAMWCLGARYSKSECDRTLHDYLKRQPTLEEVMRFYAFLAMGGMVWSLWGLYRTSFGADFGNYNYEMFVLGQSFAKIFLELAQDANL